MKTGILKLDATITAGKKSFIGSFPGSVMVYDSRVYLLVPVRDILSAAMYELLRFKRADAACPHCRDCGAYSFASEDFRECYEHLERLVKEKAIGSRWVTSVILQRLDSGSIKYGRCGTLNLGVTFRVGRWFSSKSFKGIIHFDRLYVDDQGRLSYYGTKRSSALVVRLPLPRIAELIRDITRFNMNHCHFFEGEADEGTLEGLGISWW